MSSVCIAKEEKEVEEEIISSSALLACLHAAAIER